MDRFEADRRAFGFLLVRFRPNILVHVIVDARRPAHVTSMQMPYEKSRQDSEDYKGEIRRVAFPE